MARIFCGERRKPALPQQSPGAILQIAVLALAWTHSAYADVDVRVGFGAGCQTGSIQSAINAANNANGITNILIASNQSYTAQALDISSKNVRLIGGYASCQAAAPTPSTRTQINGQGGSRRSIVNVSGVTSVVAFYNLTFLGGDELTDGNSYGGAIDVLGNQAALVYIENVGFESNVAGLGGALSIRGWPGIPSNVFVRIADNVSFSHNEASAGGGIYCRDATLTLEGRNIAVRNNTSSGIGGGMMVDDCIVRFGTNGPIFGLIANSAAAQGGGLYAFGSGTRVDFYNIDELLPFVVSQNVSGSFGGGIDIEQGAKVFARDIVIQDNLARDGGGAVAVFDDGARDTSEFVATPFAGDISTAVQCREHWNCNLIVRNTARRADGVDQEGSAIRASSGESGSSDVVLAGTRVAGNVGANVIWNQFDSDVQSNPVNYVVLEGALVDGNQSSDSVFRSQKASLTGGGLAAIVLRNSTVAGNTIGTRVFSGYLDCLGASAWLVERSIIWQPGKALFPSVDEGSNCIRHSITNDLTNAPQANAPLNRVADPQFVNATAGDFRLLRQSIAVDFTPVSPGGLTRDRLPRSVDDPTRTDGFGFQDAGAYERTPDLTDLAFADGFE